MKSVDEQDESTAVSELQNCLSCGNSFSGQYCNRCGERIFDSDEKSLIKILSRLMNTFLSMESKVIRTIRLMITDSGQFSLNHMRGVRVQYVKPISVFLFVNLLYFVFPVFQGFNAPLRTQMHFLPHNELATEVIEERIEKEGTTLADYTVRFEQHSSSLSRLLLVIFVVLAAIPMLFLNYTNNFYFIDHLTVSFEFNSLFIFISQLLLPWFFKFVSGMWGGGDFLMNEIVYSIIVSLVIVLLFHRFEKRVYMQDDRTAWIKAGLMVPGLFIVLQLYRILLFFVTVATL